MEEDFSYIDGDPERLPSREIVIHASRLLRQATIDGRLFPMPLEELIYECAYSKGYECGFNNEPKSNNPYKCEGVEYKAWLDGWLDGTKGV